MIQRDKFFKYGVNKLATPLDDSGVRVCSHIRGAKFSISINNDEVSTRYQRALMWLYKYNFKATVFDDVSNALLQNLYETGVIDVGFYIRFGSSYYNGLISDPVDYTAFDALATSLATRRGGNPLTSFSYGQGVTTYKTALIPKMLGGRNSTHSNDERPSSVGYGVPSSDTLEYDNLTIDELISRPSTIRYNYYGSSDGNPAASYFSGSFIDGQNDYSKKIKNAGQVSGFYSAFSHWRWVSSDYIKRYLEFVDNELIGIDAYRGNYSEIMEYYYVKTAIDTIGIASGVVTVDYSKKFLTSPYENITTKLWIEFNAVGTAFENLEIQISITGDIIQKDTNLYMIGVDLDFALTQQVFTISTTGAPSYLNLTKPVVTFNGTNGITSDQDVTYTLFRKLKTEQEWEVVILEYELVFSSSHTFVSAIDLVTYDYYLGFSNAAKITGTIEF